MSSSRALVVQGDARRLPLPDNSVHAVVTDPPYALLSGSRGGSGRSNNPDTAAGRHGARSGGFMGLAWDAPGTTPQAFQAWCQEWATEALRVLRPGGWLLAFGSPRTWHRLTCGIEDAGFELRDQMAEFYANQGGDATEAPTYGPLVWNYGSGFP